MGERSPICSDLSSLKKVVLRALTKNQILLLNEIDKNSTKTITSISSKLSDKLNIPLSTLKLNSRILKEIGLIQFEISQPVELTKAGKMVLEILGD